jgi:hypothetical protein
VHGQIGEAGRGCDAFRCVLAPAVGLLTPKPKLFAALAQLNRLVADQAWATPGVITPALRATLQQALPLLRPDGTPWSAADFFDAFIGGC